MEQISFFGEKVFAYKVVKMVLRWVGGKEKNNNGSGTFKKNLKCEAID